MDNDEYLKGKDKRAEFEILLNLRSSTFGIFRANESKMFLI